MKKSFIRKTFSGYLIFNLCHNKSMVAAQYLNVYSVLLKWWKKTENTEFSCFHWRRLNHSNTCFQICDCNALIYECLWNLQRDFSYDTAVTVCFCERLTICWSLFHRMIDIKVLLSNTWRLVLFVCTYICVHLHFVHDCHLLAFHSTYREQYVQFVSNVQNI